MPSDTRHVFFLEGEGGGRFCLLTRPAGVSVGSVLYVHPFAEEMNKSRRMIALAARAFSDRGFTVLQTDLFGCGDSDGDLAQATLACWLDDIDRSFQWLGANAQGPYVLWGLRAGTLLATQWLGRFARTLPFLMWQPVLSGRQHLAQFLRSKAAGEMLADADARAMMSALRSSLASGTAVEVAGYLISPALARDMESLSLALPDAYPEPVALFETSFAETPTLSPAMTTLVVQSSGSGNEIHAEVVQGASFWQTQEIETVPELIVRSCAWLEKLAQ